MWHVTSRRPPAPCSPSLQEWVLHDFDGVKRRTNHIWGQQCECASRRSNIWLIVLFSVAGPSPQPVGTTLVLRGRAAADVLVPPLQNARQPRPSLTPTLTLNHPAHASPPPQTRSTSS